MADASKSILEIIQGKERELALREAEAQEYAAAFVEKAQLTAAELVREQTLSAHEEAQEFYERRAAEIYKQKEQLLLSQSERLREMEKHFQQRFQLAVNQVIQWVWDTEVPQSEVAELEAAAKGYR